MQEAASANATPDVLNPQQLSRLDAYWRAANYLSVGQIYLLDNPLLREPLQPGHIKPRLLGHWGTTPGLNFIYVHLNRVIKARNLDVIFVCGPGHGGPAVVANTYLEGTYSEIYPSIGQDAEGMRRLFRQFSFPGGIPSHAAPNACERAYPSSPPSWIEPGVSGATWLGIPPGNENCVNSRRIPSSSRLTLG